MQGQSTGSAPLLTIRIESQGRSIEGPVVDAQPKRMVGELSRSGDVLFPIGQEIRVSLLEQEEVLGVVDALVVARRASKEQYSIRLQDTGDGVLKAFLEDNQRGHFRARPDSAHPIGVSLRPDRSKPPVPVELHDISISGVGVLVSIEDERNLYEMDEMEIVIRLPTDGEVRTIAGTVKHRSLSGSSVLYGIAFDAVHTPGFSKIEESIREFVAHRHVDMIRWAKRIVRPG